MSNNLELKDYLNIVNSEIQIKQHQIDANKPNFYPLMAIFIGFIASSTITSMKSDITSFWFLLGIITIVFLSLNKFLIHRRMFISKNFQLIENQKENSSFTKLIKQYYRQTYSPLVIGFLLVSLFGILESFLFPSAAAQILTILKDYMFLISLVAIILLVLSKIFSYILRRMKRRLNEIVFSTWITKHSLRLESITDRSSMYVTMFLGSIILIFWKGLDLKNFEYEFLLYVIFIGMWVILVQMLNLTNIVDNETQEVNFLNRLKCKILFGDISNEQISKSLMMTNITSLEKERFFLFFSYCYYSINKPILDNLNPNDLEEFLN